VDQLQYIIVGHELHHLKVIHEKYDYKYKRWSIGATLSK
jgi:hypothetical protein